jgi:hypothetical protein
VSPRQLESVSPQSVTQHKDYNAYRCRLADDLAGLPASRDWSNEAKEARSTAQTIMDLQDITRVKDLKELVVCRSRCL